MTGLELVQLAFFDTNADTDFLARIVARKSRVSDVRMYRRVGRVGVESVSVSVSAPWNASLFLSDVVGRSSPYDVSSPVCIANN